MKERDKRGFAVLEGLLILVIITMIGGVGWYVWHSKNQTDRTLTQSEISSQATLPTTATKDPTKFVRVAQKDGSVKDIGFTALNDKQLADILKAVQKSCDSKGPIVGVSYAVLGGDSGLYRHDNEHAYLSTGCRGATDDGNVGFAAYLHKSSDGTWAKDAGTQNVVDCGQIDGKGYAATIVPKCFDVDQGAERAPVL